MAVQKKQGKGGVRKYGRNTAKCAAYESYNVRKTNKLKRIAKSNGRFAHKNYRLGGWGNYFPQRNGDSPYLVFNGSKGVLFDHWTP